MRVGFYAGTTDNLSSVAHILSVLQDLLAERHELVPFPDGYREASPMRRRKIAEEILRASDVIVAPVDSVLMGVRSLMNAPVPLCLLMLGALPRGGLVLQPVVSLLRASDILSTNGTADMAIARAMFDDATPRLLPFAYDEATFYPPAAAESGAMRARLGIPARAPVVLYAGRCTVEKNVHTVLKVFGIVRAALPDAHLVLAGPMDDVRFGEFGVYPLHINGVVQRIISRLGLTGSVHYTGALGGHDLRALYGAADVMLNLSLHHDENFGLGQVEAMACGTPVVGTRWGGLQDTIVHGQTGYHVSTCVTGNGVKSSWWEAASRVVQLLRDPELRSSLGRRATEVARERFSRARHGELLDTILEDALYARRRVRQILRPSGFAQEVWDAYRPGGDRPPAGRRPDAYGVYRRLITPYTGTTPEGTAPDQPVSPEQVVFLAHPVAWNEDGTLAVNDAQFPCDVPVPAAVAPVVRAALAALGAEPVTTVGALSQAAAGTGDVRQALTWMLAEGLVLRASPLLDALDPPFARGPATTPLVSIRRVDHPADIVYVA